MKLLLEAIEKYRSEGLPALVLLAEQEKLLGSLPKDRSALQNQVQAILKNQASKVLNDSLETFTAGDLVVCVFQLPQKKGLNREDRLRLAASRVGEWQKSRSLPRMAVAADQLASREFRALCEGFLISAYDFRKYKSEKKPEKNGNVEVVLLSSGEAMKRNATALEESEAVCRQINLCRDLVNEPGSSLDPEDFAQYARQAAKECGLAIKIRDEKKLRSEGFSGLWTVGKGSDRPPRMVTLGYDNGKSRKGAPHFVMVGKGITFDTGGISIKPSQGMWEMKCDMAGAATVLTALCAIAALKLPIKASAVLCLAENRPGNGAVLPGDIFTAKNGKTVMVDNTDAEGRLVLTDGLAEAGALGATHIIDLATLTGAIVRAIGPSMAGLFSNDAGFTQTLFKAADAAGEKFVALPLEEEYREYLDDPVADMKNVGKQEAGAITAALFLQEFVPAKTAWSHWDIAGTAFTTVPWKYYKPGGTGWGVKSLVEVARQLSGT
ncbi:MAG TPA: leucyl aminopeptidase family protein [Fibrobacteria bacterium]|nr:leucyl aminopeptidase family protein [Fibrobacteria bacterium]